MWLKLNINDEIKSVEATPETPLLYILRDDFGLNGAKFGCGLGQCGACMVHVEGVAVRSCVTPVGSLKGKSVTTLEGLGSRENPHPLQTAFIDSQALQCGYCSNGMIMTAAAFLSKNAHPTEIEIRHALSGNLCRCGTHTRIIKAIKAAAKGAGA